MNIPNNLWYDDYNCSDTIVPNSQIICKQSYFTVEFFDPTPKDSWSGSGNAIGEKLNINKISKRTNRRITW